MEEFKAQYEIVDAVEHQKQHPTTFELPDERNRRTIQIGEWAKLIFRFPVNRYPEVERMWVRVTEITSDGYKGVLDNDPENVEFIGPGVSIVFDPRHVISIYPPRMYLGKLTLE